MLKLLSTLTLDYCTTVHKQIEQEPEINAILRQEMEISPNNNEVQLGTKGHKRNKDVTNYIKVQL
jgi:hypothetical protein